MGSRKAKARKKTAAPKGSGWDPAICYTGMLIAAIVVLCQCLSLFATPSVASHYDIMTFGIGLGLGLGFLLVQMRCLEAWTQPGWARSEVAAFAGCGLAMALLSYWCGMRQFGGFDQSLIVEAGWRLYSGQKPYVDFPCLLPVGFYLGAELAFRWFGVFWSSIIKFNVLYLLLTYCWLYLVARRLFQNRFLVLLLVITAECMTMLLDSYWWYNPIADIAVAVYAVSVAGFLLRAEDRWMWVSLCLSLVLVALMKPNVSGVAILGFTCALLLKKETRWKACIISLVAFVIWLGVLAIHGSTAFQVVGGYLSAASRGLSSKYFLHDSSTYEQNFAWACLAAVVVPWLRPHRRRNAAWIAMAVAGLLTSLDGFYSNSEPKLVDLSPALLCAALLLAEMDPVKNLLRLSSRWTAYLILVCSTFTVSSIDEAVIRHRIAGIGLGAFFEYQMDNAPFKSGFFEGVRGGYNMHLTVDAITDYFATHPTTDVYFGPRLQWAYAAYGIPSPKGMPIWWDPDFAFPARDEDLYTDRWINHRFDTVVMMDAMFFNNRLLVAIRENYALVYSFPLHPDAGMLSFWKGRQ